MTHDPINVVNGGKPDPLFVAYIDALRNENIMLRRLLELSISQTSEVTEKYSETTDKLIETTVWLERSNAWTETLLAKTSLLLAQHVDLLGLIACIERDETGGTLQ